MPAKDWPSGTFEVLYDHRPVARLDLSGPAHTTNSGRTVPTPHYQRTLRNGREEVVSVDLDDAKISRPAEALHWLLSQVGIQSPPTWVDPPLQRRLPSVAAAQGKRRKKK
jgi:hypothetical protein